MLRRRRAVTFAAAAGITVLVALRGGSYDTIARGELGLVLWAVIALGLGLGILPRGRLGLQQLVPPAAMSALAAFVFVSLAWTSSDERTYAELARVLSLLGILAAPGPGAEPVHMARRSRRARRRRARAQRIRCRDTPRSGVPAEDRVTELFGTDRLSYPFGYWNAVGAWGAMAAAMGLAWSAHQRTPWFRALALAAVPIAVVCVYLTYSRGGSIGLAVGALAVLFAEPQSMDRRGALAGRCGSERDRDRGRPRRATDRRGDRRGRRSDCGRGPARRRGRSAHRRVAAPRRFDLDRIRLERRVARTVAPGIALVAVDRRDRGRGARCARRRLG